MKLYAAKLVKLLVNKFDTATLIVRLIENLNISLIFSAGLQIFKPTNPQNKWLFKFSKYSNSFPAVSGT